MEKLKQLIAAPITICNLSQFRNAGVITQKVSDTISLGAGIFSSPVVHYGGSGSVSVIIQGDVGGGHTGTGTGTGSSDGTVLGNIKLDALKADGQRQSWREIQL